MTSRLKAERIHISRALTENIVWEEGVLKGFSFITSFWTASVQHSFRNSKGKVNP